VICTCHLFTFTCGMVIGGRGSIALHQEWSESSLAL
jgi:hypothetical protein